MSRPDLRLVPQETAWIRSQVAAMQGRTVDDLSSTEIELVDASASLTSALLRERARRAEDDQVVGSGA